MPRMAETMRSPVAWPITSHPCESAAATPGRRNRQIDSSAAGRVAIRTPAKLSDTRPKRATVSSSWRAAGPKRTAALWAAAASPPCKRGNLPTLKGETLIPVGCMIFGLVVARSTRFARSAPPPLARGRGRFHHHQPARPKPVPDRLHRDGKGLPRSFVRCQEADLDPRPGHRQVNLRACESPAFDAQPSAITPRRVAEQQAVWRLQRGCCSRGGLAPAGGFGRYGDEARGRGGDPRAWRGPALAFVEEGRKFAMAICWSAGGPARARRVHRTGVGRGSRLSDMRGGFLDLRHAFLSASVASCSFRIDRAG